MNLAELDPRDEWWADLCAEVAQAAPAHLDSLVAPAPDAAQAAPQVASAPDGVEDSTRDYGSGTCEADGSTSEDRS
jgi:hypothetical protein